MRIREQYSTRMECTVPYSAPQYMCARASSAHPFADADAPSSASCRRRRRRRDESLEDASPRGSRLATSLLISALLTRRSRRLRSVARWQRNFPSDARPAGRTEPRDRFNSSIVALDGLLLRWPPASRTPAEMKTRAEIGRQVGPHALSISQILKSP